MLIINLIQIKMKKQTIYFLIIIQLGAFLAKAQLPTPINNPSWNSTPVFSDDFTGTTLNSANWNIANNFNHYGEVQCYTNRSQNVSLSNGSAGVGSYVSLKLQRETTAYTCPSGCWDPTSTPKAPASNLQFNYTSGWIDCLNKKTIKYGYIEANISVPYDNVNNPALKLWPAFWTSVEPGTNPYSSASEIDIIEQVAGYTTTSGPQDDKMLGSSIFLHYADDAGCPTNTVVWTQQGMLPYSYANSFHKYACKWTPTEISWYFDDYLVMTYVNPPFVAEGFGTCSGGGNIYNGGGVQDPVYLILNLAYQGNMTPTGNELTLSAEMKVDYIKIFEQNAVAGCSTNVSGINYDFTSPTYDNKIKNSINIGGTGANINTTGTITFPSNPNISLQAAQSVELGAGFTTPSNSTIVIDVPGCPK